MSERESLAAPLSFEDAPLLGTVLPPEFVVSQGWLTEVNQVIDVGSVSLIGNPTTRQLRTTLSARLHFQQLMQCSDPESPIGAAFTTIERHRKTPLLPRTTLGVMRAAQNITGDAGEAIAREPLLLATKGTSIEQRARYFVRLTNFLGWDGNPVALLRQEPAILNVSLRKIGLIARLAQEHGRANDVHMSGKKIAHMLVGKEAETQLLALANQDDYSLGDVAYAKKSAHSTSPIEYRDALYRFLGEEEVVKLFGKRLLHAYFKYRPPDNNALEQHPHLTELLDNTPEEIEEVTYIDGTEPWLALAKLPTSRKGLKLRLEKLNKAAHIGSGSALGLRNDSPLADKIFEARLEFFRLLGWSEPKHPFYKKIQVSLRGEIIPNPAHVVGVLNVLTKMDIDIARSLSTNAQVLRMTPQAVTTRFELIRSLGHDPTVVLSDMPYLLYRTPQFIAARLSKIKPTP